VDLRRGNVTFPSLGDGLPSSTTRGSLSALERNALQWLGSSYLCRCHGEGPTWFFVFRLWLVKIARLRPVGSVCCPLACLLVCPSLYCSVCDYSVFRLVLSSPKYAQGAMQTVCALPALSTRAYPSFRFNKPSVRRIRVSLLGPQPPDLCLSCA